MHRVATLALIVAGAAGLTATSASAEIVCNTDGDCWHVRQRVEYKPEFRLQVHPDDWRWAQSDRYRWREHAGRGYWRNGIWIDIQ